MPSSVVFAPSVLISSWCYIANKDAMIGRNKTITWPLNANTTLGQVQTDKQPCETRALVNNNY